MNKETFLKAQELQGKITEIDQLAEWMLAITRHLEKRPLNELRDDLLIYSDNLYQNLGAELYELSKEFEEL